MQVSGVEPSQLRLAALQAFEDTQFLLTIRGVNFGCVLVYVCMHINIYMCVYIRAHLYKFVQIYIYTYIKTTQILLLNYGVNFGCFCGIYLSIFHDLHGVNLSCFLEYVFKYLCVNLRTCIYK